MSGKLIEQSIGSNSIMKFEDNLLHQKQDKQLVNNIKSEQNHDIKPDPSCYPQIQNVVSTVNLHCKLELKQIALQCRNAEYNPKRFAAVIMRLREPKTTALIFASGKIVCTGAKDTELSLLAAKKYARTIQKVGFDVKFKDFKVQNIVGSCGVNFPIKLDQLQARHAQFCQYEPELFPGLIYRMINPKIVLLIFVSGKLVLTGGKELNDINQAFSNIYPVLQECQKQDKLPASKKV